VLKSASQLADEVRSEISEIQVSDVRRDIIKHPMPYLLLDVREPYEVASGSIPGAVPVPRGVLETSIQKIMEDENAPIVCYCGSGIRSLLAAQQLKRMGYTQVKSMAGGFRAWRESE
jgi:rhodanese-related sulfurtransferase